MPLSRRLFFTLLVTASHFAFAQAKANPTLTSIPGVWQDDKGHDVHLTDFAGKPTVFTMIYTQCKRTCPGITMGTLQDLQTAYDERKESVDFVLVTFDPDADHQPELAHFKEKYHVQRDNWHLLRGSQQQTHSLAEAMGLGDYYKMDDHILHGFKILLLNKDGQVEHSLDWDHTDITTILNKQ